MCGNICGPGGPGGNCKPGGGRFSAKLASLIGCIVIEGPVKPGGAIRTAEEEAGESLPPVVVLFLFRRLAKKILFELDGFTG